MHRLSPLAAVLAAVALLGGCGADRPDAGAAAWRVVASLPADAAAALAPVDQGGLLVGELRSGLLRRWDPATGDVETVLALDVATEGQRGLLSVLDADVGTFVSRIRPDGRLVVEHWLDEADATTVWLGPASTVQATGGRLVAWRGGLVVGIGDLLMPGERDAPGAVNGRLLVLDPAGPADQEPVELSGGWNNPFALATDGDLIWVADNAPGAAPERLATVDPAGTVRVLTETQPQAAPSGLALVGGGDLARCEFLTGRLVLLDRDGREQATLAEDCRYGVAALPGDRLAYAAEDRVVVLGAG